MSSPADPVPYVVLFEVGPAQRPFAAGDVFRLLVGLVLVASGAVLAKVARAKIEASRRTCSAPSPGSRTASMDLLADNVGL